MIPHRPENENAPAMAVAEAGVAKPLYQKDLEMNLSIPVPFHGNTLYLVEHNGEAYTPMKPIVEGMGLDWAAQFTKVKQRFASTIAEIAMVAEDGKQRLMTCLPLRKLPGWLYSISVNKVKPALRELVARYQTECDDVLWSYWTRGEAVNPRKTSADARTPLRAAVSMLVGKKGLMYPDGYALVHQRFGVEHIDQLAPEQIGQAVEYIHRLVLEGEVLPAEKKGAYHFPKETAAPHDFERRAFINVNMTPDVLLDSRNRAPELELIEALERDGHDVDGAKIRILALRDVASWQVKLLAMMEDVRWRLGHQADRIRQCTDQRGMNVVFDKKPTKKMLAAAQGKLPLGSV